MGASSLGFPWDTPSKHPSCQVATDCPTPTGSCPMELLVQGAKPATPQEQGLAPRQQLQQLKQPSMVLEEPESSLASEGVAFLEELAPFLGLGASQGLGLLRQLPLQRLPQRLPSTELLEA